MISNKYIFEQIEDIIKDEAGCEYWDDCISCEHGCFVKKILDIITKARNNNE